MAKKTTKNHFTPEIVGTAKKKQIESKKSDVIDVDMDSDDDFVLPEAPGESLLPKMAAALPVVKQSTALKVQDPRTLYLKEISRHKLL